MRPRACAPYMSPNTSADSYEPSQALQVMRDKWEPTILPAVQLFLRIGFFKGLFQVGLVGAEESQTEIPTLVGVSLGFPSMLAPAPRASFLLTGERTGLQ